MEWWGAVEGETDEFLMRRLASEFGIRFKVIYPAKGKDNLLKKLPGYNRSAHDRPWFVLIDLDRSFACAPEALKKWLPERSEMMIFKIAVRSIESWLMADRENFAKFFRVPLKSIPESPDDLENPKKRIIQLMEKSSSSIIRNDMIPTRGSGRKVGKLYSTQIQRFLMPGDTYWQLEKAMLHSESLSKCITNIRRFIGK